jgi:hypothetical protein
MALHSANRPDAAKKGRKDYKLPKRCEHCAVIRARVLTLARVIAGKRAPS